MNQPFMPISYQSQSPFVWPLAPHQAQTLAADEHSRALWVHEGRVWLTGKCATGTPQDVWLEAGQSHTLPAGSVWVVEAWPEARVSVLQAAQTVIKPRAVSSWALPWRLLTRGAWRPT